MKRALKEAEAGGRPEAHGSKALWSEKALL